MSFIPNKAPSIAVVPLKCATKQIPRHTRWMKTLIPGTVKGIKNPAILLQHNTLNQTTQAGREQIPVAVCV